MFTEAPKDTANGAARDREPLSRFATEDTKVYNRAELDGKCHGYCIVVVAFPFLSLLVDQLLYLFFGTIVCFLLAFKCFLLKCKTYFPKLN